jgi:signal transduction histidine kinase
VTPDAVLHRYVEVVTSERLDVDALYRVITLDADLLARWVTSLGCAADPPAIRAALAALQPDDLRGLAQGQLWSIAPSVRSPRLGYDEWRVVLRAACFAEILGRFLQYPASEAARLRTLLAISGINVSHDPLMAELVEFRGAAPQQLIDAHPLIRTFAVVEALEDRGAHAAAEIAETLFQLEPGDFGELLHASEGTVERLVQQAGVREESGERWRDRLWSQAQIQAYSNVIAGQTDSVGVHELSQYVTRSLFSHVPRVFLFDAERGTLTDTANGEPDRLTISAMNSRSVIARALRERRSIEAGDAAELPVIDRQVMRRLEATQICAVPMLAAQEPIGILVFRVTDRDRGDANQLMQTYAAELGRWLAVRRQGEAQRRDLLDDYRRTMERRLRELVHEANNPLSIISNYLHILEMRLHDQEGAQDQLRLIGSEIRRATSIIARAVEVPQVTAPARSTRTPDVKRFDLNEVARKVLELISGQAARRRVHVRQALSGEAVLAVSDPDMVTQIMTNLVRNAVEAMPGGGNLTVETASGLYRQGKAGAELIVRDDGPGIPDAVLARLYEPKPSTKGGAHAGLGLHITAQLVERLEGAIDVRTQPGRGTSFSVFVPNLRSETSQ